MSGAVAAAAGATAALAMADHPLRQELNDELHARPSLHFNAPALVSHVALLNEGVAVPVSALIGEERYGFTEVGAAKVKWERHTEFTTVTVVSPIGAAPDRWRPPADPVLEAALRDLPGHRLTAVRVLVTQWQQVQPLPEYEALDELRVSLVADGRALVASDFRIHPDGWNRIHLGISPESPIRKGSLVRRLLEIETYRAMALLGLPEARALTADLERQDRRLRAIAERTAASGPGDDRGLLAEVTLLSAEVAAIVTARRFRFEATRAYARLVDERIEELGEERFMRHQRYASFIVRRFQPAVRTCTAAERRLDRLAASVDQAANLLRTRVQVALEEQNAAVLATMERRTLTQLRLQRAVEGLSILITSYYLIGLIKYAAEGLAELGVPVDPKVAAVVAIPIVLIAMALTLRNLRRRFAD